MSNALTQICADKRRHIAAQKALHSEADLRARAAAQSPPRGFKAALDRAAAIARLPLPSTRMLLSREAWLRSLQEVSGRVVAEVVVSPAWRTTVKSRCYCLAVALSETLACPVAVEVA